MYFRTTFIETPFCSQGFLLNLWICELEVASLLGYDGALLLGFKVRNQFCDQATSFLRIQITNLLGNINQRINLYEDRKLFDDKSQKYLTPVCRGTPPHPPEPHILVHRFQSATFHILCRQQTYQSCSDSHDTENFLS